MVEQVPVGGYVLAEEPIEINVGRPRTSVIVRNTGDRPILGRLAPGW